MKKYVLILLMVVGILATPADFSGAQTIIEEEVDPNPEVSRCIELTSPNLRLRARDATTGGEVSLLQDFLYGERYLLAEPTGFFGTQTLEAVKKFQRVNGISPTGYVGKVTRKMISDLTCKTRQVSGYLSIEPARAELKVGGTVEMKALYQPPMPPCPGDLVCPQVMPSSYPVRATWISSNPRVASVAYKSNCPSGAQCFAEGYDYLTAVVTGISVDVANITAVYKDASGTEIKASATVSVVPSAPVPSLKVITPNGGETWTKETDQRISWKDSAAYIVPQYYDIKLSDQIPCTGQVCPTVIAPKIYTIANKVSGTVYSWRVGVIQDERMVPVASVVPDGSYVVTVCSAGTNICDSSDNYFKIVSAPKVCTQDVLQCSDGSYVSRTSPNCEFAACPVPRPTTPVVSVSADPASLPAVPASGYGYATTISWSATNDPTSCYASWAGSLPAKGSKLVYPTASREYSVQCTNSAGTGTGSVKVTVGTSSTHTQSPPSYPTSISTFSPVQVLSVFPGSATLKVGGTVTFEAKIGTVKVPATWTTSDAGVATVASVRRCTGVYYCYTDRTVAEVKGISAGEAKITVSYGGQNKEIMVKVEAAVSPTPANTSVPLSSSAVTAFDNLLEVADAGTGQRVVSVESAVPYPSCSLSRTMRRGMYHPEVACLQKILNAKGFGVTGTSPGTETSYFGDGTLSAVLTFQQEAGLPVDGIVGPNTIRELLK